MEGAIFDGWKGAGSIVEASTITTDRYAYICSPGDRPDQLYDLPGDPGQAVTLLAAAAGSAGGAVSIQDGLKLARDLRTGFVDFLSGHGASETRTRAFTEPGVAGALPREGDMYVYRDAAGQAFGFALEETALQKCAHRNYPAGVPALEKTTFGAFLDENPKNLVYLWGQYYWAEDLA